MTNPLSKKNLRISLLCVRSRLNSNLHITPDRNPKLTSTRNVSEVNLTRNFGDSLGNTQTHTRMQYASSCLSFRGATTRDRKFEPRWKLMRHTSADFTAHPRGGDLKKRRSVSALIVTLPWTISAARDTIDREDRDRDRDREVCGSFHTRRSAARGRG